MWAGRSRRSAAREEVGAGGRTATIAVDEDGYGDFRHEEALGQAADYAESQYGDGVVRQETTRARLLSFTPYQPKRDRLCTDTASLLRPLVRAGIIDTWATDHGYPSQRAWRLLPSKLALPRQLPLDGYVEPDGGITLFPLPETYDEPPLCMLDWVIDWTATGGLDSDWWTTAVHVTTSAGLPATGTLRP